MRKYSIFIGIDLSKRWFDAAICIGRQSKQMPHKRFVQTLKGYESFLKWVETFSQKHQIMGTWLICMEHTGMYAMRICDFLESRQFQFVLENPLRIKRSMGLRREKNDKADACTIAEYAFRFHDELEKRRPLPSQLLLKIQALLSLRARLVKYHHGLKIAQQELTISVNEQISEPVTALSTPFCQSMNAAAKEIVNQVEKLIRTDERLKKHFDLLLSIVGIGRVIAAYLLVHTNGFTAFDNPRSFACHIGIVPFDWTSGTSVNLPPTVSNIAHHQMKALLSTAAISAVRFDPQLKAYFNRQLKRGKAKGWIYNAVKNKLVHRIFKVIKRGTPYVIFDH